MQPVIDKIEARYYTVIKEALANPDRADALYGEAAGLHFAYYHLTGEQLSGRQGRQGQTIREMCAEIVSDEFLLAVETALEEIANG